MSRSNDPIYIEFIARLRAARKKSGISQEKLAQVLGADQTFISKVETCERRLDVIEAARWCAALSVRLEDLLPGQVKKKRAR